MEKEKIKQLIENNIAGQAGMNPYNQALVDVLNALADNSGSKNWYTAVDTEIPSFEEGHWETTAEIAAQLNLSEKTFLKWWNHERDCIFYLRSEGPNAVRLIPRKASAPEDIIQDVRVGDNVYWSIIHKSTGSPTWQIVGIQQ